MSLLLKALKQAEASEKAASVSAGKERRAPDLDLEPLASPMAQARDWVEPPGLLFGSSGLSPAPAAPPAGFHLPRLPRLSLVPATALIAALIAVGYGIYLYRELQPPTLPPAASAPVAAAQPAPPLSPLPAEVPNPAPEINVAETSETAVPVVREPSPVRPPAPRAAAARPESRTANAPAPGAPRFQADTQSALLARAYAAYQSGNLTDAERHYAQAAASGRSVDALLGLATIASLKDRDADALRLYRQVLDLDPRNPTAQAALLDLVGNTDPQATESRLKTLIDRDPSPQLHQTLGNLYADQRRWSEAQAAYFEAFRGAPDNADYAFNLAVSLDQLRQYAAARSYYEKALTLGGAHRFDRAQAETRVQQLQSLR